jgi:long-chain acyl-CoA synthetase
MEARTENIETRELENAISLFDECFVKFYSREALVYLGQGFTYGRLKRLIERFATGLTEIGVKSNDRVIIYLPNIPQWIIAFLGTMRIGAVAVPISPIYTPTEVAYMSNDSGAETIICQDTNFGYVKATMEKSPLKKIIYTNIADMLPWWKRAFGFLFDLVPRGKVRRYEETWHFMELLKYPQKPPQAEINAEEDLAFVLYTGGTTGLPKGVPWSHRGFYYALYEWLELLKGTEVEQGHCTLIVQLPLFHILGMEVLLAFGFLEGNLSILIPQPVVDAILECIQRYKANLFFGVPALYRMILENDRLDRYDLSRLEYCWSGGDVLPDEVYNRWLKNFGLPIHQIYGATEVSTLITTNINKSPELRSVGRLITCARKEFKLVDPDTLQPVAPGTPGELCVSAPWLLKSYLNKPEETAESFVKMGGEVYYRTRDVLEMKDGELFFVDRSADVIKHKGYRVSASEIEAALQDHPGLIGACVVGVPDSKVGERIKAFVVLKDDVRGVSSRDLIKWCRKRLAPYKVPQYIEFRDMLPKSKVGKLLRREMRDEERRRSHVKKF